MSQVKNNQLLPLFEGFCKKVQTDKLPVEATLCGKKLNLIALTTAQSQAKGYMGAGSPPKDDEGLLFIYDRPSTLSFWMKNVNFPLDIIFFDQDRKYLSHHSMKPYASESDHSLQRYNSDRPAQFAVEVNSGWCDRHLKEGATLDF